jgi:hypothetical protein
MVEFNLLVTALAALIPLITGFIWYHPKVLGNAWMKQSGLTEDKLKGANMAKIFGLTYLLSFFLSAALNSLVIHQFHFKSILLNEPGLDTAGSELNAYALDFFNRYGQNFRTFKHGMLHGFMAGVTIALPIIGIIALFERRSAKYVWIHTGYFIITMMLMGGVLCQFV